MARLVLALGAAAAASGRATAQDLPGRIVAFDLPIELTAAGDLNGDGTPDFVSANSGGVGTISVRLSDGDGGHASPMVYFVHSTPRWLTIADVDGDGEQDVTTVSQQAFIVTLLINDGTGGFTGREDWPFDARMSMAAFGDVDGDGLDDMVTTMLTPGIGSDDGRLGVRLADATAGFLPPVYFDIDDENESDATKVVLAHVDADRWLDALVLMPYQVTPRLKLMRGDGAGGFLPAEVVLAGGLEQDFGVGDFDRDGVLDVAVTGTVGGAADEVRWRLGTGDGDFGPLMSAPVGESPAVLEVADFDADGNEDLLVACRTSDDLSILSGDGAGGFGAAFTAPIGTWSLSIDVGDFDADGLTDVAVGESFVDGVLLLRGTGPGALHHALETVVPGPDDLAAADVNADGHVDLVTSDVSSETVTILLGDGELGLTGTTYDVLANGPRSIAVGDVTGDGFPDIVMTSSDGEFVVALGDGAGGIGTQVAVPTPFDPILVELSDVDRDGLLDIVGAASWTPLPTNPGQVYVVLSRGAGGFDPAAAYLMGSDPVGLAIGDVNRDGRPDVVTANEGQGVATLSLRLGVGTGDLGPVTTLPVLTDIPRHVTIHDFDVDGAVDLVVGTPDAIVVFPGDGTGSFTAEVVLADNGWGPVVVDDVTGDGFPDLVRPTGYASVGVSPGDGAGLAGPLADFAATNTSPATLVVADLDQDGRPELVLGGSSTTSGGVDMTVLTNRTAPWIWSDLGGTAAGAVGKPILVGTGTLLVGEKVTLTLSQARPSALAYLVIGNALLGVPFKGGVLVPDPAIVVPVLVGPDGVLVLHGPLPPGTPSGFSRYFQFWITDALGPSGFAASNGVAGTTP